MKRDANCKKIPEKLRNSKKKRLRKFVVNFILNLGKVCRKPVEFEN